MESPVFVININPVKAVVAIPPTKIMPRVEILIPEVHFSPCAAVDAPTIFRKDACPARIWIHVRQYGRRMPTLRQVIKTNQQCSFHSSAMPTLR